MKHKFSEVRVRFAPSPTGYLHVGGARTALFNYLYAKQKGGKFIYRIEDTDQARSTEEFLRMQMSDMLWLGLNWDEGPHPETLKDMGDCGPYRQSQRLAIYKKHADELISKGKAYYCFLTDAEIDSQRQASLAENKSPHVNSPYQDWPVEKALEKIKSGEKAVVRFKTKDLKKDYKFRDLVRGEVVFPSDMVGDFVLLRSDGMPVYNFCCVVDDGLMKISHVLRAEEHLSNTLRQLMLYEALEWPAPEFGHMSLILGEDKQKLSKRHGATSCNEYKEQGYMPEAIKNFIALLGWSSPEGKEIVSIDELIKGFEVERLNPAPAVFDEKKLKWMNSVYLRNLPNAEIYKNVVPFLEREGIKVSGDEPWQNRVMEIFKTRMETFRDAIELFRPLSDGSYAIQPEAEEIFTWESSKLVLTKWKELIKAHNSDHVSEADFLKIQDDVKNAANVKGKHLFMPIRVAVIGKPHGVELKDLIPLMSKKSLEARVDICLARFQ